jgi:hypothetical protein
MAKKETEKGPMLRLMRGAFNKAAVGRRAGSASSLAVGDRGWMHALPAHREGARNSHP